MDRKMVAGFSVLMLSTVAFVFAPAATAYGVGCNGSKTTKGNVTREQQNCTATVNEGGYIVCIGYSMQRVTGGDDPGEATQCGNGVRPGSGMAPPTVESPLLP